MTARPIDFGAKFEKPAAASRASTLTDLALQKAGVAQNTDDAGLKQAGPVAPPVTQPVPAKPRALQYIPIGKVDSPAQGAYRSAIKAKKDAQERVNRIRSNSRWNDGSMGRPADLQLEMMQARSAVQNADRRIRAAEEVLEKAANEQGKTTKRPAKKQPATESARIRALLREAL